MTLRDGGSLHLFHGGRLDGESGYNEVCHKGQVVGTKKIIVN